MKQKNETRDKEIQKLQKNVEEATSLAGEIYSKHQVANEFIKSIKYQVYSFYIPTSEMNYFTGLIKTSCFFEGKNGNVMYLEEMDKKSSLLIYKHAPLQSSCEIFYVPSLQMSHNLEGKMIGKKRIKVEWIGE